MVDFFLDKMISGCAETYLLVDGGYFKFFRHFAAKSWYQKAQDYTNDEDMQNDPIFKTTLRKRCIECIEKIIKKEGISWDRVIFCDDCRKDDIWRNSLISNYKGTRQQINNVKTGFSIVKETIHELVKDKGCLYYKHPFLEADDIVSIYRNYILDEYDPEAKFIILASDIDYYQLLEENTKLMRLDKRDPMKSFSGDPEKEREIKIIMGDKSDNISSIHPKCGYKTAEKYLKEENKLLEIFLKHPEYKEIYERNRKLVDFRFIPKQYIEEVWKMFK